MAAVEATIRDQSTSNLVPVEGIAVTGTPSNPTTGQVLRQSIAIGDGSGANNFALVTANGSLVTLRADAAATTGTVVALNGSTSVQLANGAQGVLYVITGTWVGTLAIQVSADGSTWTNTSDILGVASTTANLSGAAAVAPYQYLRFTATAWTSGTANISLQPISSLTGGLVVGNALVGPSNPVPIRPVAAGLGIDTAFPGSVSTSGTSLGTLPTNGRGIVIHLPPGAGVSMYVAATQAANAAAAVTVAQTYLNSNATSSTDLQINLVGSNQVWITNIVAGSSTTYTSGLPIFRFI